MKSLLIFTSLMLANLTVYGADDPNSFNRLFKPPKDRVEKLNSDGIHDTASPALSTLQEPSTAFKPLKEAPSGNYVDWMDALNKEGIKPRFNYGADQAQPMTMDLTIVRQVKGSMPDVAFPHQAHTQWLECTNCHDQIFKPIKGGNTMSMAEIMLGQKCGVCHGSIAFPVTDCRRCHSVNKTKAKK